MTQVRNVRLEECRLHPIHWHVRHAFSPMWMKSDWRPRWWSLLICDQGLAAFQWSVGRYWRTRSVLRGQSVAALVDRHHLHRLASDLHRLKPTSHRCRDPHRTDAEPLPTYDHFLRGRIETDGGAIDDVHRPRLRAGVTDGERRRVVRRPFHRAFGIVMPEEDR
jgi:hypothetical protein